jgi:cobalt-zinc-cadmium efflux system membrane fusion protein
VVERNITPGQELRPDQSGPGVPPLFVVSDPTSLWVLIDARETEVAALRPGSTFQLLVPALPGEKFEGKVLAASDFIDAATRTIKVRGLVQNPQRKLKAEMLATARIHREAAAGVIVPAGAVLLQAGRHAVFVQVQPGTFEPRPIQVGWQGPAEVLVTAGLAAGEQVVAENTLLLARQYAVLRQDQPPAPVAAGGAATAQGEAPRSSAQ